MPSNAGSTSVAPTPMPITPILRTRPLVAAIVISSCPISRSRRLKRSSDHPEAELHCNCVLDLLNIGIRQLAGELYQSDLAHCCELVGHSLVLAAAELHVSLTGIEAPDVARERHDLKAIEVAVRYIVAHNDRRALPTDFASDRWAEAYPPDLTADHQLH